MLNNNCLYIQGGYNFVRLEYQRYFQRYENIVNTKVLGHQEDYNIC